MHCGSRAGDHANFKGPKRSPKLGTTDLVKRIGWRVDGVDEHHWAYLAGGSGAMGSCSSAPSDAPVAAGELVVVGYGDTWWNPFDDAAVETGSVTWTLAGSRGVVSYHAGGQDRFYRGRPSVFRNGIPLVQVGTAESDSERRHPHLAYAELIVARGNFANNPRLVVLNEVEYEVVGFLPRSALETGDRVFMQGGVSGYREGFVWKPHILSLQIHNSHDRVSRPKFHVLSVRALNDRYSPFSQEGDSGSSVYAMWREAENDARGQVVLVGTVLATDHGEPNLRERECIVAPASEFAIGVLGMTPVDSLVTT